MHRTDHVRFPLIKKFSFTVPKDFRHGDVLAEFEKKELKKFYDYHSDLSDEHFSRVSHHLVPGNRYGAKIFGVTRGEILGDCLEFLRNQHALFVGAQGLFIVIQCCSEEFPLSMLCTYSLDKMNNLWMGHDGKYKVPCVGHPYKNDFRFGISDFDKPLEVEDFLLCVYDL